jgi:hypothetical protein
LFRISWAIFLLPNLKNHGSPAADDGNALDVVAGLEAVGSFFDVTVDYEQGDQTRGQTDILTDRFQAAPIAVGQHNAILLIKPVSAKRFQQSDRPHDNAHGDPGTYRCGPCPFGSGAMGNPLARIGFRQNEFSSNNLERRINKAAEKVKR